MGWILHHLPSLWLLLHYHANGNPYWQTSHGTAANFHLSFLLKGQGIFILNTSDLQHYGLVVTWFNLSIWYVTSWVERGKITTVHTSRCRLWMARMPESFSRFGQNRGLILLKDYKKNNHGGSMYWVLTMSLQFAICKFPVFLTFFLTNTITACVCFDCSLEKRDLWRNKRKIEYRWWFIFFFLSSTTGKKKFFVFFIVYTVILPIHFNSTIPVQDLTQFKWKRKHYKYTHTYLENNFFSLFNQYA